MKKKKTMTLAHAIIIAFTAFMVFTLLQIVGLIDLYLLGYNICSWVGFFFISMSIAWLFNKQPVIIKFCISIIIIVSFLLLYSLLAESKPNAIPYVNALGAGILCSYVICFIFLIFASIFSKKKTDEKTEKKSPDDPQYLINYIYQGRYVSRDDLFRFYTNYTSQKDTFIDLLNAICDVCADSIKNDSLSSQTKDKCQKVNSIVKPILDEEKEVEYLMNVTGKERASLLLLHKFSKELDESKHESALHHLALIADFIISTQKGLIDENKRNTQSLTISIVGILLTILFSLLSFLAADEYSALHLYFESIIK